MCGDTLLVNGHRTHHIRDSRFEAARASRLLSAGTGETTPVIPIIAVVAPASLTIRTRPQGVMVLAASQLARTRRKRIFADATVDALVAAAELRGTWHTADSVVDDTLRHESRFARLRAEVDAARRRRRIG